MNPKRLAHLIISRPPLVWLARMMHERRFRDGSGRNPFRGVYPDFAAAERSSPQDRPKGYDNEEGAGLYDDRPIYSNDYPVMFWLQRLLRPGQRVFDFGGHTGCMFDAISRHLVLPEGLTWQIYDVPCVVERGRKRNTERKGVQPSFTSEITDGSGADVFLASGSLQYLERELPDILAEMQELPSFLLINQTPLHDRFDFVTLQNIRSAYCPYRIRQRESFLASPLPLGYEQWDLWENPGKNCPIPTYPHHSRPRYHGALFVHQSQPMRETCSPADSERS